MIFIDDVYVCVGGWVGERVCVCVSESESESYRHLGSVSHRCFHFLGLIHYIRNVLSNIPFG